MLRYELKVIFFFRHRIKKSSETTNIFLFFYIVIFSIILRNAGLTIYSIVPDDLKNKIDLPVEYLYA